MSANFSHRFGESSVAREARGRGRGGAPRRRARKAWLLTFFGDGVRAKCRWCSSVLDRHSLTADRYPVAGIDGGTYRHGNIVPACRTCNETGVGRKRLLKTLALILGSGKVLV